MKPGSGKRRGLASRYETLTAGLGMTFLVCIASIVGCAGPKPILYPNAHYQSVGQERVDEDIAECRELAEKAGATPGKGKAGQVAKNTAISTGIGAAGGAVGGAIVGAAGTGSAIGAASGLVWGLLSSLIRSPQPSQAYTGYVDRCLKEKGYDPTGWE